LIIIIPALSSSQSFHGDLLRKLAGVSLIERSIDLAHALSSISSKVVIVTDSDEIRLMGERNGVTIALTPSGRSFGLFDLTSECGELLTPSQIRRGILVLSPYAPLLTVEVIESAHKAFIGNSRIRVLAPMRKVMVRQRNSGDQDFIGSTVGPVEQESSAFVFLRSLARVSADNEKRKICFFQTGQKFSKSQQKKIGGFVKNDYGAKELFSA
jgi:CMP-N-acetylneuraminic acid synthetase